MKPGGRVRAFYHPTCTIIAGPHDGRVLALSEILYIFDKLIPVFKNIIVIL